MEHPNQDQRCRLFDLRHRLYPLSSISTSDQSYHELFVTYIPWRLPFCIGGLVYRGQEEVSSSYYATGFGR